MEKKEARIKCTSCGSGYKVRLPVTDKPVTFKCKKCGKVMKLKVKPSSDADASVAPPPPPPPPDLDFGDGPPDLDFGDAPPPPEQGFDNAGPPPPELDFGDVQAPAADAGGVSLPDFESSQLQDGTAGHDSAPAPQAPTGFETGQLGDTPAGFETTQLPDAEDYGGSAGPVPVVPKTPSVVETHYFAQSKDQPSVATDDKQRWVVLAHDDVKGPFTDEEIVEMVKSGEIGPETSLRMGERPWIKAIQVSTFRSFFPEGHFDGKGGPLPMISLGDASASGEESGAYSTGRPFYEELPQIIPYPVARGDWKPLAIFLGIAFVLSAALNFEFLLGFPLNVIGWIVLYGYLASLMQSSALDPENPPPPWDLAELKNMATMGGSVFLVLLAFSLVPMGICLLLMIAFYLNGLAMLGHVFMLLTVAVFAVSMFVVPASLVILGKSRSVGSALNPGLIVKVIKGGGTPYRMLVAVSAAAGLACMIVTIMDVFLTDIPLAGFIVAGLLSAIVFSYGHFIWFHVLGRFSRENPALVNQVLPG
jgi:predicted RNA-binding Zn-ribbon protein involved in translation (DUF1610 family)